VARRSSPRVNPERCLVFRWKPQRAHELPPSRLLRRIGVEEQVEQRYRAAELML
jgi:hypothetical protein